jgi:GTP-binding protein HflX
VTALVGYTNAGKSTLFNALTSSDIYAADQLFATLDTTLRRMNVPGEHPVLLSDTVGFIRDLPPDLVAAFQGTLEETRDATLLLHVIDCCAEDIEVKRDEVLSVLERVGASEQPILEVYNKIDLNPAFEPRIDRGAGGEPVAVWVSARTGAGLDLLRAAVAARLDATKQVRQLVLSPREGRLRAQLYAMGAVLAESINEAGEWILDANLSIERWGRLFAEHPELTPADYAHGAEADEWA